MDAIGGPAPSRCDLHVHSIFSTDSGNYALRRARLGESFTEPERVDRVCRLRGMRYVTITDHDTLEGALRIQHLHAIESAFCGVPPRPAPRTCSRGTRATGS
jgi:hypothetical protein